MLYNIRIKYFLYTRKHHLNQFFDYTVTFVNLQHEKTISKGDFFPIDQQIAQHFVFYTENLSIPLPFYAT